MPDTETDRRRAVIVGAGFAGLAAARELARDASLDVVIVDRNNFHTFQPFLYQVATAGLTPSDIAYPVRGVFRGHDNVGFVRGCVTGVDWESQALLIEEDHPIDFDYLVLAAGSSATFFGIEGAEEFAYPLYSLGDAARLRNQILTCCEKAERDRSAVDEGALSFVVVGAGPTGVETVGALHDLVCSLLAREYHALDPSDVRLVLLEMLDTVLPPFSEDSRRYAHRALTERGIEVKLGTAVEAVTEDGVRLDSGEEIPTKTVVWTAGLEANSLANTLDLEQAKAGRIVVCGDLRVPGHPNVFVAGDLAHATDTDGKPYPQLAPVAMQQGAHVAEQIHRDLHGLDGRRFRYRDRGVMATIGRRSAVAEFPGGRHLTGTVAWLSWLLLHLMFLLGFRNRVSVLVNWAWAYLAWNRGPRLIFSSPRERTRLEVGARAPIPPPGDEKRQAS